MDPGAVVNDLEVTCPRCGARTVERFYGPCEACRHQLRVAYAAEAREIAAEVYEPKMNVTPNQVASRE